jgi:signal transduction histidine kinase
MKIIAFNDISSDIAENEELAWARLIRVLTHEIMNTVTPIASLSETLSADITSPDLQSGLATIAASSRSLIKFVDTYRTLTRVATPVKRAFMLKELVDRVLNLSSQHIADAHVTCRYIEKTNDILLYADEGQISQILINLIRNAIQAGATTIDIVGTIEPSDAVRIDVINNGASISRESQSQIFIPFFSTKPDGTGIGLSLSRQIMRLHNGTIRLLRSDDRQTVFSLLFK